MARGARARKGVYRARTPHARGERGLPWGGPGRHFAGTGHKGLVTASHLPLPCPLLAVPPQAAAADHALEKAETEEALAAAGRELTALRAQAQAAAGADGAAQQQLAKAAQALLEAEKKVAAGEKTARTLAAQLKASAEADEAAQVTPYLGFYLGFYLGLI